MTDLSNNFFFFCKEQLCCCGICGIRKFLVAGKDSQGLPQALFHAQAGFLPRCLRNQVHKPFMVWEQARLLLLIVQTSVTHQVTFPIEWHLQSFTKWLSGISPFHSYILRWRGENQCAKDVLGAGGEASLAPGIETKFLWVVWQMTISQRQICGVLDLLSLHICHKHIWKTVCTNTAGVHDVLLLLLIYCVYQSMGKLLSERQSLNFFV